MTFLVSVISVVFSLTLVLLRQDQRLMLTGAHVTLVSTMDHLAVANLLEGRTQKALKMLRRIYELQKSAHGASDPRCFATRQKIMTIRSQQMRAASKQSHNSSDQTSKGKKVTYDEKVAPQAPEGDDGFGHEDETKDGAGDARHSRRASTGGSGTTNGSSKNKSLFKAIRSFGRKKSC